METSIQNLASRASIACMNCRARRVRCVLLSEDQTCEPCKFSNLECHYLMDDRRKKPIRRAYVSSLVARITVLESVLGQHNLPIPLRTSPNPEVHAQANEKQEVHSCSLDAVRLEQSIPESRNLIHNDKVSGKSSPSQQLIDHEERQDFHKTRNDAVCGELDSIRIHRHVLSKATHDYLMNLFWTRYNSVFAVVNRDAFEEDYNNGHSQFYSVILHLCVLAMGYRFSDKTRADMQNLSKNGSNSTFHLDARQMVHNDLYQLCDIPSVVALLVLGDLECNAGRGANAWLYGKAAVRVASKAGLHLESDYSHLTDKEVEVRRATMHACLVFDGYFSVLRGSNSGLNPYASEIQSFGPQAKLC